MLPAPLLALVLLSLICCSGTPLRAASGSGSAAEPAVTARPARAPHADVAAAIRARLITSGPALEGMAPAERLELTALYDAEAHGPLWVDGAGTPAPHARDAIALLDGAARDGLDPADYRVAALHRLAAALGTPSTPAAHEVAEFDLQLSAALLRYFRHLHLGRIDARSIGFNLRVPPDTHDFVLLLRSALTGQRITETAAELAPPIVQYALLRDMLARYRSLAAGAPFQPLPPLTNALRPGAPFAGLHALHERLVAFGDLPPDTAVPGPDAAFDDPLVEAVKRFQARHGLSVDGVLGKATLAALQVPPAWRVRQIELALERLRWLPDFGDQPLVALNIPMFHLWAWDPAPPGGTPSIGMRAIVGRAINTQTPVLVDEMRHVIFRPYWNVPRSILRNEILPILTRDPDYLRRNDMEIVQGPGDDAARVAATAENLALLGQGVLRLRQRPGPRNALGLVKFDFPNDEHVYLHGTPAQTLFARSRRDFSHGCVRVEDPVSLAEWALRDDPEWTRERILAAMEGSASRRVTLRRPVRVILFYVTAVVMPEDGTIRFAEDIYRHDASLDRALAGLR